MTDEKKQPIELTLVFQAMAPDEDAAKALMRDLAESYQAICERHGIKLQDGAPGKPPAGPDGERVPWADKIRFGPGRPLPGKDPNLN